jgi:hypothetical protein
LNKWYGFWLLDDDGAAAIRFDEGLKIEPKKEAVESFG